MVISDLPQVEGAQVALISGSAVPELQELLERCADFEVLVTGSPPHADAAADLLVEVPPDHALRDKLVIGIWTEAGLTAAIDLLRDFPIRTPGIWGCCSSRPRPADRNWARKSSRRCGIGSSLRAAGRSG